MSEASRAPSDVAGPAEDTLSVIAMLLETLDPDDPPTTVVRVLLGCAGVIRYADQSRARDGHHELDAGR